MPLSPEKTEGPVTIITFLGTQLDSVKQTVGPLEGKMHEILNEFIVFQHLKATKRDILSLLGTLSFAAKCIPAGRIFLRRMLELAHSV